MISLIFVCLICFVLSAFFAGIEMAFVSINRLKIRELADAGNNAARIILSLLNHPHHFLTTLLIGNNVVNITLTAIFTLFMVRRFGIENEWIVMALLSPVLLIFGEMLPKDYCRLRSQTILFRYSGLLWFLSKLFYIPTVVVMKGVDLFLAPFRTALNKSIFVSEEEFRHLINESTKTGVVTHDEQRLIETILDFERARIESVMTPLAKVPKVNITSHVSDVKKIAAITLNHP